MLDRLSIEYRFTLVSAMPGFGKTAAVRQWIDTVDVPVAWVSLDMLDQELESFWSNVLLALDSPRPASPRSRPCCCTSGARGTTCSSARWSPRSVERETPVLLVLDGLDGNLDRLALDGLAAARRAGGSGCGSWPRRGPDPPLPLARWRALGWMSDLREDTLRLTDDEAVAIAAVTDTAIRDADEVVDLNRRVDGWPIGLHMALLARPGRTEPTVRRRARRSHRGVRRLRSPDGQLPRWSRCSRR